MNRNKTKTFSLFLIISLLLPFETIFAKSFAVKVDPNDNKKSSYSFEYQEGKVLSDQITVTNLDKVEESTYQVYGVDGITNSLGQSVFKSLTDKQTNLGSWIEFEEPTFTLKPEESKTVTFKINIPENVIPGYYTGGISVQEINNQEVKSKEEKKQSFGAKVSTRIIHRVYVNIPGEITINGDINSFKFQSVNKSNFFTFNAENTGNTILKAEGKITITGGITQKEAFEIPVNIAYLNVGEKIENKISIPKEFNYYGNFQANLDLKMYSFDPFNNITTDFKEVHLSTTFKLIPWDQIFLALKILALLIILITAYITNKILYLKKCEPYTVQEGDTVNSLAKKHNMSWRKLAKINKLKAPYELTPGQSILVKKITK